MQKYAKKICKICNEMCKIFMNPYFAYFSFICTPNFADGIGSIKMMISFPFVHIMIVSKHQLNASITSNYSINYF